MVTINPEQIIQLRTEIQCSFKERELVKNELSKTDFIQVGLFEINGDYQLLSQYGHYNGALIIVITKNANRHQQLVNKICDILKLSNTEYQIKQTNKKYI